MIAALKQLPLRRTVLSALALCAVVGATHTARADDLVYNLNSQLGVNGAQFQVPVFDTRLGTLQGIRLNLEVDTLAHISAVNNFGFARDLSAALSFNSAVNIGGLSFGQQSVYNAFFTVPAANIFGSGFGLVNAKEVFTLNKTFTDAAFLNSVATTGLFNIATAQQLSLTSPSGFAGLSGTLGVDGVFSIGSIDFVYTSAANAAPSPIAGGSLMGLGLLGFGVYALRRRRNLAVGL